MKKRIFAAITAVLFIHITVALSQWSTPIPIDSTRQVIYPIIAVSPKDRQIAVVSQNVVYISNDHGKTFQRRFAFAPPVSYWQLFYPGGVVYDSNGALWILWLWDECSDNKCTFPIDYWVYLSKSIDSGRTFQYVIRQRRGLAGASGTPRKPWLAIDRDNAVHFLYDSLPRLGETYKLGNDLTYCKLPNGDSMQRVDVRLPPLPDSMDFLGAFFSVSPWGRVHVTMGGSPASLRSYILYTHSLTGTIFKPYGLYDTINPPRQNGPNHIFQGNQLIFLYLVSSDPFDTSTHNHIFLRRSLDDGESFQKPVEIFIAPFSIRAVDSMYFYSISYSSVQGGLEYYKYVDILQPPIDSAFIGRYFDPQFALDDSGGKYLVMNDDSSKAFFSIKDVITSVAGQATQTLPKEAELRSAPNPFNGITTFYFTLPRSGHVKLGLYDLSGRKVRDLINDMLLIGEHRYVLDAGDLASGIYLVGLVFEHTLRATKISLIK